jgi:hypothetical protein
MSRALLGLIHILHSYTNIWEYNLTFEAKNQPRPILGGRFYSIVSLPLDINWLS